MKNNVLDSFIRGKKSIAVAGHVRPDGDCAGSTLAVYNYVRLYYPEVYVKLFLEPIPNIFKFLQNSSEIDSDYADGTVFDLFIALDCGDAERLGRAYKYFEAAKETLCIDHHISNENFAMHNYVYPQASSTCELVFEAVDEAKITKGIAECLYTGIVHDTGVFQYSCTSAKTMGIAGILMGKGIDYPKIIDDTFYTKTFDQNRILGQALLNSRLYLDGKCIVSVISDEEMKAFHVLPKHLEGIVNQLRVTKGVLVALFLYETEEHTLKGSLRANGDFNVAEVAAVFGGGGHVKAAGFSIDGPADEAVGRVLREIEARLQV